MQLSIFALYKPEQMSDHTTVPVHVHLHSGDKQLNQS